MRRKDKYKLLAIFLVLILFGLNYTFFDKKLTGLIINYEVGVVERVIDGDTLVVNKTSVRLLGINTPEKGEMYYSEAKDFLNNTVFGRLVKMESGKDDRDRYNRKLRYVILDGNVNIKLVENGYANPYFPSGKDRYYTEFYDAWENCISKNVNLCEKSKNACSDCIKLKRLDVGNEEIVLGNTCSFSCNLKGWTIKDEGRKKFTFPDINISKEIMIKVGEKTDSLSVLYWKGEDYVWTSTGDALFLRDSGGKLVLWWNY